MQKSHDKLSQRLVCILIKLNNGESFTVKELAQEFNVDERTVQRDIKERLYFLPIEKDGKYYRLESYALGKLTFKDIKTFATLSGIQSLYPELSNEFISDILNSKLNQAYLIKNQNFENISSKKNLFETLTASIVKNSPVSFKYNNKNRFVNPYKLINNQGIWYLLGEEDDKLKTFSFSKIKNFKWTDENKTFTPKQEFLEQIKTNDTNWFSKQIEVILQIDNKAKEYFFRKNILANQKILEEKENYFLLQTKVGFDDEILKIVKSWLPFIRIVEPIYLKEKFDRILVDYLNS